MARSDLELRRVMRIKEVYQGKSGIAFWKNMKEGDEIMITTQVKYLYRSNAQTFTLTNARSGESTSTGGGDLANRLSKMIIEYVD